MTKCISVAFGLFLLFLSTSVFAGKDGLYMQVPEHASILGEIGHSEAVRQRRALDQPTEIELIYPEHRHLVYMVDETGGYDEIRVDISMDRHKKDLHTYLKAIIERENTKKRTLGVLSVSLETMVADHVVQEDFAFEIGRIVKQLVQNLEDADIRNLEKLNLVFFDDRSLPTVGEPDDEAWTPRLGLDLAVREMTIAVRVGQLGDPRGDIVSVPLVDLSLCESFIVESSSFLSTEPRMAMDQRWK